MLTNSRAVLMERWSARVLNDPDVPDANLLSAPALEDHIPELLDRLIQRLTRHPKAGWGEDVGREVGASAVGVAHAQHRFQLDYSISEALRELSHFRATVLDLCVEQRILLNPDESGLLHATIDEMMRTSASEFERAAVGSCEVAMGVIAHDLRNPLSAISMYAARLRDGHPLDMAKMADVLSRNVQTMERLVEDLLVYSKIESGQFSVHPADVDLTALVRAACDNYLPAAHRRRIDLSLTVPDHEVSAYCDADRILQALGNLVGNAIKFTPEGGSVRVELEQHDGRCLLRVRDSGPGIRPEHEEHVFRCFWQAPGSSSRAGLQGVGLGLAIARGIAEAHGGELALERHPPPGASFVLRLPYKGSPRPSISLPPAAPVDDLASRR